MSGDAGPGTLLEESDSATEPSRPIARHHRLVATGFGVAFLVILLGVAVGMANPWNYLYVDRWLNHPIIGGLLALGCLYGVLWCTTARRTAPRVYGTASIVVVGVVWCLMGASMTAFSHDGPWYVEATSPDGQVELAVHETAAFETIFNFYLQTDDGLRSRRVHLFSTTEWRPSAEFVDDTTVAFETNEARYTLTFDPETLHTLTEDCVRTDWPRRLHDAWCPAR
jgi:hypothetical protein